MEAFAQLYAALDGTTRTAEKVAALTSYFRGAPAADAAWALWFLSGNRLPTGVRSGELREWVAERAGIARWLVDECYEAVGDLAETLALLLPYPEPEPDAAVPGLARWVEDRLVPMAVAGVGTADRRALMESAWRALSTPQRFLWNKLVTGGFRVGVSRGLLARALAQVAGVDAAVMNHRLMGAWQATPADFGRLLSGMAGADEAARPYPFCLAAPLEGEPQALGEVADWQVEWKWDGIRVQLLRRAGQCLLWSRGEEVVTASFPEVAEAARSLPEGTVLDGELVAWGEGRVQPFARLQRRLNRKVVRAADRAAVPVALIVYDLLESGGVDWRPRPLSERRAEAERLLAFATAGASAEARVGAGVPAAVWMQGELFGASEGVLSAEAVSDVGGEPASILRLSARLDAASWDEVARWRAAARAEGTEGVMLKRREAAYGVGRQRGVWWKWKVDPFTCDAVLVAAQPGHGRRASLFTDYTFAVWDGDELVPVAKAYSGLSDVEIEAVDAFVRSHGTGRFGPVRSVAPELVFELAFDGVAISGRHKAGVALRFPRMARWRTDKRAADADTLESLMKLAEGKRG